MKILSHLEPEKLWSYFEEICAIPRISKHEEQIIDYLKRFAQEHDLKCKQDSTGNLLITKPSYKGFEKRDTIVLQSHVDMVGAKTPGSRHDWYKDPIKPIIKGEWVMAKETTLGADDGIGIAAQLAILADKDLECGKIEALFTVDEETGMTGAIGLEPTFFKGRRLLNLDSEDEGIIFIGCAGGIDTMAQMKYSTVKPKENTIALKIKIYGLHGGHSGDEIHKGYGNAIKILGEILFLLSGKAEIALSYFEGGNLRNAIPREAKAKIIIKSDEENRIRKLIREFLEKIKERYIQSEQTIRLSIDKTSQPEDVMDNKSMIDLLKSINECPNGVISWSEEMPGLVETSTNLAIIKTNIEETQVTIATSQRSSIESSKKSLASSINDCFSKVGMNVSHSDGYPGWKPDMKSFLLEATKKSYIKLFGREPEVTAIHAGLECGLFYEKIEGIDMISIGPTIKGAHTTEERIEIKTVIMFWDLLLDVIKNL
jgi:dipeptidase D